MEVADSIQADSLEVLVIGQAFEGVPWGYVQPSLTVCVQTTYWPLSGTASSANLEARP